MSEMGPLKRFMAHFALIGAEQMRDDPNVLGRDRMRYARWARVLKRKIASGRGVIKATPDE